VLTASFSYSLGFVEVSHSAVRVREAGRMMDLRVRNRFGPVYVDFDTLERTRKISAEWFRQAARQDAVV
jgi:hypothetical protein